MPVSFQITIADEDLAKIISALQGGSNPPLTDKSSPPAAGEKRASAKKAAPEPAPEPEPEPEQEAPTTDLVTAKQTEAAEETSKTTDLDEIRSQLTDYYVGQGSSKKDVQNAISGMNEEELRNAYLDYLARLVMDKDGEFTGDFETPYIATRVDDGKEVKRWVVGGVTLSDEQVAEKKLAPAEKKGPALPSRKK